MSENKNVKGIRGAIRDFIYHELFPQKSPLPDIVSTNAKVVLYGLFALVGLAILTYSITLTGGHFTQVNSTLLSSSKPSDVINGTRQQVESLQQLDQVNAVYIAAISGSLALGGTLIAQLWGKGGS